MGIADLNSALDILKRKPELLIGSNHDLQNKSEIALEEMQRKKAAETRYSDNPNRNDTRESSSNPFGGSSNPFGGGDSFPF